DGAESEKQDAFIKTSHPSSSRRRGDRFSPESARVVDTTQSIDQDEVIVKITRRGRGRLRQSFVSVLRLLGVTFRAYSSRVSLSESRPWDGVTRGIHLFAVGWYRRG